MKHLFILAILFFSFSLHQSFATTQSTSFGDHRQEIQGTLDVYFQANLDKDYEKILDMIYPRLFEIVSKEEMMGLFKQMEAEGIDYSIKAAETSSISDKVVNDGQQFVLVKYILDIGIRFTGEEYSTPEVQKILLETFKTQYGKDRVKLDTESNTFWIKADNVMFAIAPEGSKDWKFMEKKPGMEAFVADFIPQEVQDKLVKE